MKLLFFDEFKLGVLKGAEVVDVSAAVRDIPHTGPHNLISGLIERFAHYRTALEQAAADGHAGALESADGGMAWARDHLVEHDDWTTLADNGRAPTGGGVLPHVTDARPY